MAFSFTSSSAHERAPGAGVTAVLGPTNTGKTHLAIERMVAHSSGVIGLPLRLLAREVYNKIVDRVGSDYPRMIALSHPELRPEDPNRIARYSQQSIDLIDLEENRLATLDLPAVLETDGFPRLDLLMSVEEEGYLVEPVGGVFPVERGSMVLTFNNLIRKTDMVRVFRAMLACLEEEYGCPVEIEFTASVNNAGGVRGNLLQCRPLFQSGEVGSAMIPDKLETNRVLFRSTRMINGGTVTGIRYLIYIDPGKYSAISDNQLRTGLGRLVGKLNGLGELVSGGVVMVVRSI